MNNQLYIFQPEIEISSRMVFFCWASYICDCMTRGAPPVNSLVGKFVGVIP